MDLLQHGVDRSVIALWLGHESMETTQVYLHANLELKEGHWQRQSHSMGAMAVIAHQSHSWPSSKASNNAELKPANRVIPSQFEDSPLRTRHYPSLGTTAVTPSSA